jgi:hypothetical protein
MLTKLITNNRIKLSAVEIKYENILVRILVMVVHCITYSVV